MIDRVEVTRRAEKSLAKAPREVAAKFFYWKQQIEEHGLEEVKKIPGYHDEPLQGKLKDLVRSVRMSRGYRAFYRIVDRKVQSVEIQAVLVEEVNLHDYKEIERLFGV